MLIFICIGSVNLIVTCHDRFGAALFDRDLEACQIDLAERTFIQNRIHGHTPQLLAVHRKMLGAGINSLTLDSSYVGCSHLSRKVWIL